MAKSSKKQALGRGLSAILNDPTKDINSAQDQNAEQIIGTMIEIPIESISANPHQPRTNFKEEGLRELGLSIKELGIIQPITVRKTGFNAYELVSGERRFRAAKSIGLTTLPAYIRIANDQESLEMALVENIQRQDLDPIEIALSYQRLLEEIQLTQNQLSDRVGKKRSTVTNYLRLLKLDPIIQTGMRDGFLSMGHGRALINIEDRNTQLALYKKIIAKGLSVRATEDLVRKTKEDKQPASSSHATPQFALDVAQEMENLLNTKVRVKTNSMGKGSLQIFFDSQEALNTIRNQFNREA
ncbi:MAG: ParB/RepB/Spo0J family partition protein [Flavobacteriaceae bacterium]